MQPTQGPDTFHLHTQVPTGVTLVEYIWLDGTGETIRGKTKVVHGKVNSVEDLEWWTYDGSSTLQATTEESEIWIKPVTLINDPFRDGYGLIALCEGYLGDKKTPARANFRHLADQVMNDAKHEDPWFGIEQEYYLTEASVQIVKKPLGWPCTGLPVPQGPYYCSAGGQNSHGRAIAETHLRLCLKAGLKIAGINAEVGPGQWEYQVGITKGIECGDHMWFSRYILNRVAELYGVEVTIHPKPINVPGWNGSGCHTNYSTNSTRAEGGLAVIHEHMKKLEVAHPTHITVYGRDNHLRLSGKYETSSIHDFSFGTGNRGASIRIPVGTHRDGRGYYEDRRPASNMDPYLVTAMIVDTTVLDGKHRKEIVEAVTKFNKERECQAGH